MYHRRQGESPALVYLVHPHFPTGLERDFQGIRNFELEVFGNSVDFYRISTVQRESWLGIRKLE